MSSFSRYLPASVIHYGQKSPSISEKTVSRNPEFSFPGDKIEANFQEGYERWFDFSRILLPTRHFCYEQDTQCSTLEVGVGRPKCEIAVCPPLIPAGPILQSPSYRTNVRKRSREINEEQENYLSDKDDEPRKGEGIKREEDEEERKNRGKRKLILKLIQDKKTAHVREWRHAKDKDNNDVTSSFEEENSLDDNKIENSASNYSKMGKSKLEEYLEKRRKNNASAKKSREARRMRELQTQIHAAYLEDENSKLRTIVGALRKENTHLRDLLIV
jgi:hypothetical protein